MAVRIKESLEKPEWFDLEKYSGSERLDAREWSHQLLVRYFILHDPEWYSSSRQQVRKLGIVPCPKTYPVNKAGKKIPGWKYQELRQGNVWSLDCISAYENVEYLSEGMKKTCESAYAAIYGDTATGIEYDLVEKVSKPVDIDVFEKELPLDRCLHVVVDIEATDEQVVSDFKNWLKEARKYFDCDNMKRFTSADSRAWSEACVLPYLDLMDWITENQLQVSQNELGKWLFPDSNIDTTEKIRKGTKPLAKRLLRSSFISSLRMQ